MTVLLALTLLGCPSPAKDSGGDTSPPGDPTFTDVAEVFTGSCAFSSCHGASGSPAGGLDLSAENAYANIVDVPSVQQPEVKLVVPGDAAGSYLYLKCAGEASITSDKMPPPDGLDAERLAILQGWIDAGAPNN